MLERCRRITRYIGIGRVGFFAAEQLQDAVIGNSELDFGTTETLVDDYRRSVEHIQAMASEMGIVVEV